MATARKKMLRAGGDFSTLLSLILWDYINQVYYALLKGNYNSFCPGAHIQLIEDIAQVGLDSTAGEVQSLGYVFVA